jgi:hypothetical protein
MRRSELVMYFAVGVLRPRLEKHSLVDDESVKERPFITTYSGSGMMAYSVIWTFLPHAVNTSSRISTGSFGSMEQKCFIYIFKNAKVRKISVSATLYSGS